MDERAHELIAALLDGTLDEAGGEELLAAARRDSDVVAEIARQRALDGWLHARARPLDVEALMRALPDAAPIAERVLPRLPRRRAAPRPSRAWVAAVAAALLAIAALVWWPRAHDGLHIVDATGVAMIRSGATARAAVVGGRLRAGERLALAPGATLALATADGARFALTDSAMLGVDEQRGGDVALRLDLGALDAAVTHRSAGEQVRIATPHAEAVVVGTRFVLRVDALRTRLRVDQGAVRFTAMGAAPRVVAAVEEAVAPPVAAPLALRTVAQGYADEQVPGGSFPGEPLAVRGPDGRRRIALVRFAPPDGARIAAAELVLHRASGAGVVIVHAQPEAGAWTSADLRFYHVPAAGPVVGPLRDVDGAARCDVTAEFRAGTCEFLLDGDAGTDCAFAAVGDGAPTLRLTLEEGR